MIGATTLAWRAPWDQSPGGCMRIERNLVVAAAVIFVLAAFPADAAPLPIRAGWAVVPAQLTSILFEKKDILRHYGTSYTWEPIRFRGSAPQITALAAGEIDIAAFAFSTFGLAIQNAKMEDIRVIGDLYQDGIPGYYTSQYVVRADSPIKTIEDLKGKVLAAHGIGGAIGMAMRQKLKDPGLAEERDYRIVEMLFTNMIATLREENGVLA